MAPIDPEIERYYSQYDEADRLDTFSFPLERERTRELLVRYLPAPPATVLDVGGAAGAYAFWLAEQGYAVHLVDPVPALLEAARARAARPGTPALAGIEQGDARRLAWAEASVDVVLLLGPLYHLTQRADRIGALAEAQRVLRPGGTLFAAAISRFASLLDALHGEGFCDPAFRRMAFRDLVDGQHRNDTGRLEYFTTAFFHHPEELRAELLQARLEHVATLPVEGLAAYASDFAGVWGDTELRAQLLESVRMLEHEPSLLGASPHLLAVARKPR